MKLIAVLLPRNNGAGILLTQDWAIYFPQQLMETMVCLAAAVEQAIIFMDILFVAVLIKIPEVLRAKKPLLDSGHGEIIPLGQVRSRMVK